MFRRVSRCARGSGLGWRVYPPRGDSARTGQIPRRHKNDEYAAVTRGRPAFQRHESRTEGSDTAPHAGTPKKHCVQEGTACPSAQSTHSEKAVFSAETTPRGVVPTQPQRPEGSDTTPTQKCRKNAKREFNHLPQQGSRRNPAKRFRWEEDERQREQVLPLAAGRRIRRPFGRRPASHLSGLRRSRCPAKCTGLGGALRPNSGRKPGPTFSYDWRKT